MGINLASEWWLIVLGGLAGSAHCLGMCGGFVIILGSQKFGFWRNLGRQVIYASGRVCTYTLAGAIVGYCGWRMSLELRHVLNLQAWFAIAAGLFLIFQSFFAAGLLRWPWRNRAKPNCAATSFATLLQAPHLGAVFAAGLTNGLLPCGLVYAYLTLAASTGNMAQASLLMFLFGLGTLPLLILLGCGAALLRLTFRRYLYLLAAGCVTITGLLSLIRGLQLLQDLGMSAHTRCSGH